MGEELMKRCLLATVVCIGCSTTSPNVAKPLYGSECVIWINATGVEGPDFGLSFNHDLGESPEEDPPAPTRLTLDLYTYDDPIVFGDYEAKPNRKYQLVIFDAFGAPRVYLRDTLTGIGDDLVFTKNTIDPEPEFNGVAVITEYKEGVGTWVHILIGAKAEHGIRVLAVKV
ncbi:MAG: hypothetical protein E2O39_08845 [Planctomycetota bacterium]|nr:MAG: hypothetical protein E2O39_08845 [Planctomycetota bacterium]